MPIPSSRPLVFDVLHGAIGFAIVSVAAFSVWGFAAGAFRDFGGELGMYAAIAGVFLALSGVLLSPLAPGMGRFYKAFLPAFLLYAVVWCVAWFGLKGRVGEWVGAAAGCLVFTWVGMKMLGSTRGWMAAAMALFALHTAGYFAGDSAMYDYWVPLAKAGDLGKVDRAQLILYGKLSWGLFYGLGFGAGIGWVFNRARVGA
ncbi:hypothetical protein EI77_02329 [Prosthecobacter fusiformis]|uniref:Uncharacterized protein n=1 Tax=Prosthecobacter fusiformis TaxID=48464 RepID=A0A4R7S2H8_9BACT|nr:hypothetical protein [Prosthecobacter fusiformis]TDU71207.1 hypothetical protein EI77_02329 [Prosthecobacter fusiformis]